MHVAACITTQTQSYDITGLSPYQLVTLTITATNGGGTSGNSTAVEGRSSEAGDYGAPLQLKCHLTCFFVSTWHSNGE